MEHKSLDSSTSTKLDQDSKDGIASIKSEVEHSTWHCIEGREIKFEPCTPTQYIDSIERIVSIKSEVEDSTWDSFEDREIKFEPCPPTKYHDSIEGIASIKNEVEHSTWDSFEDQKINLELEPFPPTKNHVEWNFTVDRVFKVEQNQGVTLAFPVNQEETHIMGNRTQVPETDLKFPLTCVLMSESVKQKQGTYCNQSIAANFEAVSSSSNSGEEITPLCSTGNDISNCDIKEEAKRLQTSTSREKSHFQKHDLTGHTPIKPENNIFSCSATQKQLNQRIKIKDTNVSHSTTCSTQAASDFQPNKNRTGRVIPLPVRFKT